MHGKVLTLKDNRFVFRQSNQLKITTNLQAIKRKLQRIIIAISMVDIYKFNNRSHFVLIYVYTMVSDIIQNFYMYFLSSIWIYKFLNTTVHFGYAAIVAISRVAVVDPSSRPKVAPSRLNLANSLANLPFASACFGSDRIGSVFVLHSYS